MEAETAGVKKECVCQLKTDEELKYERAMRNAWSINENGNFQVKLPWEMDPRNLPNNKTQALERDYKLNRQLSKNPEIEELFSEQINEMIKLSVLKPDDVDFPKRYLPLLPVINMERDSTKIRVCVDAKTKCHLLFTDSIVLLKQKRSKAK